MLRVAIVTPVKNCAETIDEAVHSVVSQIGPFSIEYHVQDGGSADGTADKLEAWRRRFEVGTFPIGCEAIRFTYESAADNGMYSGLNKGFARMSGDVMGWINADDRLQPGALATATALMRQFPATQWLGGRHAYMDALGSQVAVLDVMPYARSLLEAGLYEGRRIVFLQQEGVFWRRELWEKCGGRVEERLRYAGDFELWCRFAEVAEYVSVDTVLGVFRVRVGQATNDLAAYYAEVDGLFAGARREHRENLWEKAREAQRTGRRFDDLDFSGPVVTYDTVARHWTLTRRPCFAVASQLPGGPRRWIRALARRLLTRQNIGTMDSR
jgi:glycosyltransferase involved in cell wall biosynthesis